MKTIMEIRKDLQEIRYYYLRLKTFENIKDYRINTIIEKVKKYNDFVQDASPKLYDVYVSLYIKNHTQESLSNELGFTKGYIYKLNKSLMQFLLEKFSNEENQIAV